MTVPPTVAVPVVLLIDDNPDDRFKISWMLSQDRQVIFHEAASVKEGIEQWEAVRPDLVLLDLRLSDGDGAGVLRRARQARWGTPIVVVVSELSLPARIDDLRNEGAQHFLPKEILTKNLLGGVIDTATRRVRLRQQRKRTEVFMDQQIALLTTELSQATAELTALVGGDNANDLPAVRLLKGVAEQHAAELASQVETLRSWSAVPDLYHAVAVPWGDIVTLVDAAGGDRICWRGQVDATQPVMADLSCLGVALTELIDNAIAFCRNRGGDVSVEATLSDSEVGWVVTTPQARISPVWQYEIERLFTLGTVAHATDEHAMGTGLAKVARTLADSNVSVGVSIDARHGFSVRLGIPTDPRGNTTTV